MLEVWTTTSEFATETLQLVTVEGGRDGGIGGQELEHDHAMHVPPDAKHYLSLMRFSFWRWYWMFLAIHPGVPLGHVDIQHPLLISCDDRVQPAWRSPEGEQSGARFKTPLSVQ